MNNYFINGVNKNEIENLTDQLHMNIANMDNCKVTFNEETNKYEYTLSGRNTPCVALYSTQDILNHPTP